VTSPAEIHAAMLAASRELQGLVDDHPRLVVEEVEANKLASLAEATTRTATLADDRLTNTKRTVQEYDAIVTKACLDERFKADLAKGLRDSNNIAIKAAMARLSALQSLASAMREEARLARGSEGP
jgi:hypothetical protein